MRVDDGRVVYAIEVVEAPPVFMRGMDSLRDLLEDYAMSVGSTV